MTPSLFRHITVALLVVLSCIGVAPAQAQISVVVAKSVSLKASKTEVKKIFSGARLKWPNGNKIQVIDQPDTEIGKKFYDKVLGKSANQIRAQWTKLLLSGQAVAPVKCASDKAVKKVVAGNPNAIGFIATSALDDSVKEIVRLE